MSWTIRLDKATRYIAATAERLAPVAAEHPDWSLTRNEVGNWSILDENGDWVGWTSPPQGQLDLETEEVRLDLWGFDVSGGRDPLGDDFGDETGS